MMLKPLSSSAWDYTKAAHLLNRAGFGGTPAEIESLHALGLEAAVDKLLNAPDDSMEFPKPDWAVAQNLIQLQQEEAEANAADAPEAKKMLQKQRHKEAGERTALLTSWWMFRMQKTPNPLREKLTLFWHGHFATSEEKVRDGYYMWFQNETLRQNSLGNFGTMVKAILRDPAMLTYLDADKSLIYKPNENFARELMELFTLGIGNYTEKDIQESARAFTGYKINPTNQTFRFASLQHDETNKTFLGKTGPFNGDDIINIILDQPACAEFISKKLWTFFAYEHPSPEVVSALASTLRKTGYELRPTMKAMLSSNEFYSKRAIRTQIKSPVQWIVNTSKLLETPLPKTGPLISALQQLGQVLFHPPNVKGWDGGKAWITTATLLARYNLSAFVVGNGTIEMRRITVNPNKVQKAPPRMVQPSDRPDMSDMVPLKMRDDHEALVNTLTLRMFQVPLGKHETEPFASFLADRPTTDQTLAALLQLMMSTPQFQLT